MLLDLAHPDRVAVRTDSGAPRAETRVDPTTDGAAIVRVTGGADGLRRVILRWERDLPSGARVLGDHWERGYGDLEWRGIVPERVLPWMALVALPDGGTWGIGVETGAASLASWRIDGAGVSLVLDTRCGGEGVRLQGRTLEAATLRQVWLPPGTSRMAAARALCAALCPAPRLPRQPVYGGNDWYYAYGNNSDQSVRRDAAAVREWAPSGDNPPWFVIDAGWFPAAGCDGGPYDTGNARFPDLPGLAAAMDAMEVRPGIWIRPLLTSAPEAAAWRLPDTHPHGRDRAHTLDPSIPEVLDLVRADLRRLVGWGYRMIKHDFTTYDLTGRWGFGMGDAVTPDGWRFADSGRTTAEIVAGLYDAIREAAGDALLIGCNTIGHLGAGRFELQRTGDDTSGREWERTRKMGVNTLAFRMGQHGTFFAADADCVGLTDDVPWHRNRQWLDLLARSGTPLFVSADPAAVGPEQRAALEDAFARAASPQPPADPLDWEETTCPRLWRAGGDEILYDWDDDLGAV